MSKTNKNSLKSTIAEYSLTYLVFVFFCVIIFFLIGKNTMFDSADGINQQYTIFVSCGNVLRKLFKNLFIDHIFELPMWDRTIGMGSDVFITYNPFATPIICLLSALIPNKYSEYLFELILIFRLYLSGLAFLFLVYEKGYKNINAIAGAMVYVFSSTTFVSFMQMNFSSTFILFPLLLLGADRVWKKDKGLLYVGVLSYSMILSFYFTYMMLILLFIYFLIRFFCEENRSLKCFFSKFSKFTALTLISVIIGIGMILPGLVNLSKLNRLDNHYNLNLIDFDMNRRLFAYAFSCVQAKGDSLIGVSSFAVIATICLVISKKKEAIIKWCLTLCLLSFSFPIIGSIFNGFNYPTTRYIFSLILCISYVVTVSFDSISLFKEKVWLYTLGLSLIYGTICLVLFQYYSAISALSLIFTVISIGAINHFGQKLRQFREKLYLLVVLFSCIIIGYSCFYIYLEPSFMDSGSVYNKVFVNGGMTLRKAVDDPKYRTDSINIDFAYNVLNSSMAAEVSGFDFYHSNENQFVEDYYAKMAILGNPMGFNQTGFRGRCYIEIMNACKYIVRTENNNTCIRAPYSYKYITTEEQYSLYQSEKEVSLVYFYDNTISTEDFEQLNPVFRETNLMYNMVMDNPDRQEAEVIYDDIKAVHFELIETSNLEIEDKKITVFEDGGYIVLKPENIEPGQISLYLSGLTSVNDNVQYRNAVVLRDSENNPIAIDISALESTDSQYYTGNDNVVFSFESITEDVDNIVLIFAHSGEYNLDDMQIYSRPTEKMQQTISAFYEHADMEDITYEYQGNHLNISASTESDRYLYIAIPYSKGWHATVDGNPVEIIRANTAFMAIPLSTGTHSIEMTYVTPYIYLGWTISAVGIILFICYLMYEKKRIKKES